MEYNKVKVQIYGQEYTIAGEEPEAHIIKVADYVDSKMRMVERTVKTANTSLIAVLSAINIASDYFRTGDSTSELKKMNDQLEKDVAHYVQMWEETKRSFLQYKEDAQAVSRKKDTLRSALDEKEHELEDMRVLLEEAEIKAKKEVETEMEKLQDKLKETESNFFDLQMENVQLKSELERFKKIMV